MARKRAVCKCPKGSVRKKYGAVMGCKSKKTGKRLKRGCRK